ncbi:hypothetical protein NDU88_005214 [Pleurodeles waltl]|uniref:Uncharacterized protein n=1 Tax=Pleurodeles waltl TaxID=8319 RepID=A0AAV7SL65_PLEWA|nr:hypothetical protein NDU88_005214 [Pleurodeles waltl]
MTAGGSSQAPLTAHSFSVGPQASPPATSSSSGMRQQPRSAPSRAGTTTRTHSHVATTTRPLAQSPGPAKAHPGVRGPKRQPRDPPRNHPPRALRPWDPKTFSGRPHR